MDGYKEAAKIDKYVNKLLEKNPISKYNSVQYIKYARTIISSMRLITEEAKITLRGNIEKNS